MGIIEFRNRLNELIVETVNRDDYEPYMLEEAEAWMDTGRCLSGQVIRLNRLNRDDVIIETDRFENGRLDALYERMKSLAKQDYSSDKNYKDAVSVLCCALDELGWHPLVSEFTKVRKH